MAETTEADEVASLDRVLTRLALTEEDKIEKVQYSLCFLTMLANLIILECLTVEYPKLNTSRSVGVFRALITEYGMQYSVH